MGISQSASKTDDWELPQLRHPDRHRRCPSEHDERNQGQGQARTVHPDPDHSDVAHLASLSTMPCPFRHAGSAPLGFLVQDEASQSGSLPRSVVVAGDEPKLHHPNLADVVLPKAT